MVACHQQPTQPPRHGDDAPRPCRSAGFDLVMRSRRRFRRGEIAARSRRTDVRADLALHAEETRTVWGWKTWPDQPVPSHAHHRAKASDRRFYRQGAAIQAARIGQHVQLQQGITA